MKARIVKRRCLQQWMLNGSMKAHKDRMFVKFTDNNRRTWIDSFEKSEDEGLCKVLSFENDPIGLVVANGRGYVVDLKTRKTTRDFKKSNKIVSVLKTDNPEYLFIGTENELFTIDREGMIHEIVSDVEVKWFYFDEQRGRNVSGKIESDVNEYEKEIPFTVNLENLNLQVNY